MLMRETRLLQESWESRHSENHQKTTKMNHKSEEFPLKSSALASLRHSWSRRTHAWQLAKLALWRPGPSTSSPTRPKRRRNLDIGVRPRGSLWIYQKTIREPYKWRVLWKLLLLFLQLLYLCYYFSSLFLVWFYKCLVLLQLASNDYSVHMFVCFRLPQLKTGVCSIASVQEIAL